MKLATGLQVMPAPRTVHDRAGDAPARRCDPGFPDGICEEIGRVLQRCSGSGVCHFRGPGRTIQFTILGRGGRLILRQVGATSLGISDLAYDAGAWISWRTQAATLRAALLGGPHGRS